MEDFALFTWTLFVLPAVWFWILLVGFFILEFICIANDKWEGALTFLIIGALIVQFGTEYSPLLWVFQNPAWFALGLLAYVIAGAGYSCIDWTAKLSSARDEYKERKREFLEDNDQDPKSKQIPAALRAKWRNDVLRYHTNIDPERLKVRYHKAWLTWRIAFWPLAGAWMLLNDPIRALAIRLRRMLNSFYEGIYQRLTGTMQGDVALIPEDLAIRIINEVKLEDARPAWLEENVPDDEVRSLVEQIVTDFEAYNADKSSSDRQNIEYYIQYEHGK